MRRLVVALAMIMAFGSGDATAGIIVPINPAATYLRTNEDPLALDATPIDLAALSISPGDQIWLERLGAYNPWGAFDPDRDYYRYMIGVFSTTSTLLSSDQQYRVPGAVMSAGFPYETVPTYIGSLPTDIPEDFWIATEYIHGFSITVPPSARYLFVNSLDSFYGPATDPNGDFALKISTSCCDCCVPEPSSLALWSLLGIVGYVTGKRRRRRCQL